MLQIYQEWVAHALMLDIPSFTIV